MRENEKALGLFSERGSTGSCFSLFDLENIDVRIFSRWLFKPANPPIAAGKGKVLRAVEKPATPLAPAPRALNLRDAILFDSQGHVPAERRVPALALIHQQFGDAAPVSELPPRLEVVGDVDNGSQNRELEPLFHAAFKRVIDAGLWSQPEARSQLKPFVRTRNVDLAEDQLALLIRRPTMLETGREALSILGEYEHTLPSRTLRAAATSIALEALTSPELSRAQVLDLLQTRVAYRLEPEVIRAGLERAADLTNWSSPSELAELFLASKRPGGVMPHRPMMLTGQAAVAVGTALLEQASKPRYAHSGLEALAHPILRAAFDEPASLPELRQQFAATNRALFEYRTKAAQRLIDALDLRTVDGLKEALSVNAGGVTIGAERASEIVQALKQPTTQKDRWLLFDAVAQNQHSAPRDGATAILPWLFSQETDVSAINARIRQVAGHAELRQAIIFHGSRRLAAMTNWADPAAVAELETSLGSRFDVAAIPQLASLFTAGDTEGNVQAASALTFSQYPPVAQRANAFLADSFARATPQAALAWLERQPREVFQGLPDPLRRIGESGSYPRNAGPDGPVRSDAFKNLVARFEKTPGPERDRVSALIKSKRFSIGSPAEDFAFVNSTGGADSDLDAAIVALDEGQRGGVSLLGQLLVEPSAHGFDGVKARFERVLRGSHALWVKTGQTSAGELKSSLFQPGFDELSRLANWRDDVQVEGVASVQRGLAKTSPVTIAAKYHGQLFGFGRERDLARAKALVNGGDPAVAKLARETAAQIWSLGDALDALKSNDALTSDLAREVAPILFTEPNVEGYLNQPGASRGQMHERFRAAAARWQATPAASRAAAMLEHGFTPAFEQLGEATDWSNLTQVRELLSLRAQVEGLAYPKPVLDRLESEGLHAPLSFVSELVLDQEPAVRETSARIVTRRSAKATSFDERLALFDALPRQQLEDAALVRAPANRNSVALDVWHHTVRDSAMRLEAPGMRAIDGVYTLLLDEARASPAALAIERLRKVLPYGAHYDGVIDEIVARQGRWVDTKLLDSASYQYGSWHQFKAIRERRVHDALSKFPGNVLTLASYFANRETETSLLANHWMTDPAGAAEALKTLKADFTALDSKTQKQLLIRTFEPLLTNVKHGKGKGQADAAFDSLVLQVLESDSDAAKLTERVKTIYSGLPARVQAKVLADLLLASETKDAPEQLRRLLVSAGLVAIKAAQQMAEDPAVKPRFREVLEDLRDLNGELAPVVVWQGIPVAERPTYSAVGPRLGTGSVKQVNWLRRTDGVEELGAVLKPGVGVEINETLSALGLVEDTKHLVDQLAPMLKREVDLTQEARSFDVLRATPIGQAGDVNVPVVRVSYPHFLARTAAPGEPLSVLQRGAGLDEAQRRRLYSLHASMARAALETDPKRAGSTGKPETYVLTDPHGGNVAFDGTQPGLFDPGQFETLTQPEAELFVWSLATFSNPSWHESRRVKFVDRFAALSKLKDPNDAGPSLAQRLDKAFDATLSEPNADVGRKLQLLLIDASKRGIAVPTGYFGLAKMLHSLESQAHDFKIRSAVNDVITSLYVDQLGPAGRIYNFARGSKSSTPDPLVP